MNILLMTCLVAGAPMGVCNAEISDWEPEVLPDWVTLEWKEYASFIVAGEAADTDGARLVTACTLIADIEKGWNPYRLRSRWFGWRTPRAVDRKAVHLAVTTDICEEYPKCRYLGNMNDLKIWRRMGMVHERPVMVWMDTRGLTTVCVP